MAEYKYLAATLLAHRIAVFAITTDPLDKAQGTVEQLGLGFPVLYGVDGPALAKAWGAHYEERRNILHATNFLLRPDGTIACASYSTGPIGRMRPDEVLALVTFYRNQAAK